MTITAFEVALNFAQLLTWFPNFYTCCPLQLQLLLRLQRQFAKTFLCRCTCGLSVLYDVLLLRRFSGAATLNINGIDLVLCFCALAWILKGLFSSNLCQVLCHAYDVSCLRSAQKHKHHCIKDCKQAFLGASTSSLADACASTVFSLADQATSIAP